MNVEAFLDEIQCEPEYAGQMVHVREVPARPACYGPPECPESSELREALARAGVERLYSHQAEALQLVREGHNILVATGTASGKTLCYALPIIEALLADQHAKALLLYPTKALCQDQFQKFSGLLDAAEIARLAGVFDGDTPRNHRTKLRDKASVIFSNPDMVHACLMPQHARWAGFLANLRLLVLDELHVYTGIFGSNMALLLNRFLRLCRHYGNTPRVIACSATIANPKDLAERLTGRPFHLVDDDGSPRGKKTYVFWNPPQTRPDHRYARRSANVEAHDLMARLVARGIPTITFSKAKMTAEMIYRYVCERLANDAPGRVSKIAAYRGGYLAEERREIEARLFSGELLGVSTTSALELGIDVGTLEASIIVGYPGTLASFFQQAGRAGRKDDDSVVFLVGLDTSINQYIMGNPDYVFDRCVEQAVIDPENPFVTVGHLRCATQELPLTEDEMACFGPYTELALRILAENLKVRLLRGRWYHAATDVPQYEVSLRGYADATVTIQDADTETVLGQVVKFDAPPILHPEAIYMHRGETYRVLELELDRNMARVKREEVDYYTQPLGGTDVHHIDHRLKERPLGNGHVFWGEVTAHFNSHGFEKINFYSLDAVSTHPLTLPTMVLETMALWLVPPEDLMEQVKQAGLDTHSGLRAIGYAMRMLLPLFITCDTRDFSHSIGSVNSPWNAIFIYERYPHGLGFTEGAFGIMDQILPAVLENVRGCSCKEGCPCCVGKPLRGRTVWNVERGEASIPSKTSAVMILEGLLGGQHAPQPSRPVASACAEPEDEARLEQALRRRLERAREPQVFHPIKPRPEVRTAYPATEKREDLSKSDVERRTERRRDSDRDLHKRLAKKLRLGGLKPDTAVPAPPPGMKKRLSNLRPTAFAEKPVDEGAAPKGESPGNKPIVLGDRLAARARKLKKKGTEQPPTDEDGR
jgi:DEAD/DEAH box helicase domain-containing protein